MSRKPLSVLQDELDEVVGKPARKRTRAVKAAQPDGHREVKAKFVEERVAKVYPLEAKTANQKKYIDLLKSKVVVMSLGSSGSGKTFVACVHAANSFLKGEFEQIVLLRPVESVSGKTLGMRPGTVHEKLFEAYQSMYEPLKVVFGAQHFEYLLEKGKISPLAIEMVRGRSFYKSIIVVDEASNCDAKTMKTLVSRIGEGSQLVICGDQASWQQDIKGESGLTWLVDTIHEVRKDNPDWLNAEDKHHLYNEIGFVKFTKDDVVRSGISSLFVKIFDEYE